MQRYFIEVAYLGTAYSGFQIQQNGNTIQGQVEKAMKTYFKADFELTGSSRTDAGVHAHQNYFHVDTDLFTNIELDKARYHLNAILPSDIVIKRIFQVDNNAHCRFDAISRLYIYSITTFKNPFLQQTAYYYPQPLNIELLHLAAEMVLNNTDFENFSKKHTQVLNFRCTIEHSEWIIKENMLQYTIKGNRFLRGMVKGLVATMLKVGNQRLSLDEFQNILKKNDQTQADFAVPAQGLCLHSVSLPF